MKNTFSVVLLMGIILVALVTPGFQCSSAEMTSARLYLQRSDWENAEKSLEKELANNPQNEEAWYLLGRVKSEKKDFASMNEAFDKALSISKAHAQEIQMTQQSFWSQYFNRGVSYYAKGQDSAKYFDHSIDAFRTAIVINPDSAATYKNLGFSYLAKGDAEGAIKPLQEVLKRENDAQAAKLLGEIYYDMGVRHRNAFEAQEAGKVDSSEYRSAMANFNESIMYLEKARSVDPQDEVVMTVLMNAYIAVNRIDEAREQFRQGAELHPENQYYQYNYGVLLLKENNYAEAIRRFQMAITVDPKYENALYNLGVAYVNWGVEMREAAEAEVQKKGRGAKINEAYKEKFKGALPHFQEVLKLRPDDAELLEQLGRVYANLNMQSEARDAFDKADKIRRGK